MKPFDVHYPNNSREEDAKPKKDNKPQGRQNRLRVNVNEQGCAVKWCEDVRLNRIEKVETDHNDSILCIYFLNDQYIATGSKDATINIYNF